MINLWFTFLRGISTKRPTKQTTKRNPVIQPNPGSLIASGEFPSMPTPASSYVFLFSPSRYDANPPGSRKRETLFFQVKNETFDPGSFLKEDASGESVWGTFPVLCYYELNQFNVTLPGS